MIKPLMLLSGKDVNCPKCVELAAEGAKCYCDEGFVWDPELSNCTGACIFFINFALFHFYYTVYYSF